MAEVAALAKYVYNSNRLDGVHIPFETTLQLIESPPDPREDSVEIPALEGDKTYFHYHVTSHFEAVQYLSHLARMVPITQDHIRDLHRRLMEGVILSNGEYRECTLRYRNMQPLSPEQIDSRMQRVLAIMNQGLERARDKSVLGWQVHHEFIHVHPFIEGNGRTARLLLNLVRLRAGLEIEIIPFAEHERYLRSILAYGRKLAGIA
ncbi:Fic family protein [Planctomycetota bacterium]